jgi:vacuolar-type H+-ATPase subunit C/Vma6
LQHENDWFRAENSKVKQHYKELYDSIKITRDKNNEKITSLLKEIENLKTLVKGKMSINTSYNVIPKVRACKKYACDAVYIPLPLRNNKLVHSDYLKHLNECLELLRETIENDRIAKPLDDAIVGACFLTNRSQELLEYVIGTCPKIDSK